MELISVEGIDFDTNFIELLFDGIFKEGFYVTTEFDYDIEVVDAGDSITNCREVKGATNITFWYFQVWNAENEEVEINERELKKIKQLVEFKLIDLLCDELNDY